MSDAENTPTRLPPPPRVVHGGAGCALWFLRLFILPHMFAGLFMTGQLLLTVLVAAFGADLLATVTKAYTLPTRKGGTIYYVAYRYNAGREYTNSETVGARTYTAVSHPEELEAHKAKLGVRYFGLGPLHYHVLTQERSSWKSAGDLLVFVLFWNGILSIFVNLAWVAPMRRRRLISHGQAATGTIVGTRVRQGKSTSYYATFRFIEPGSGLEFEREMELPGEAFYSAAQTGRAVTVLYDLHKPRRAIVYELCGHRVAER